MLIDRLSVHQVRSRDLFRSTLIAMMGASLAACSSEASSKPDTAPAASAPESAAVATAPALEQQPPRPAPTEAAPAFNYVGLWVDDPACPATDYYVAFNSDGTATFFAQGGRWSARPTGVKLDMEAAEATETSDAQQAWSQLVPIRIVGPNEFVMTANDGRETRFHRCRE